MTEVRKERYVLAVSTYNWNREGFYGWTKEPLLKEVESIPQFSGGGKDNNAITLDGQRLLYLSHYSRDLKDGSLLFVTECGCGQRENGENEYESLQRAGWVTEDEGPEFRQSIFRDWKRSVIKK